MNLDKLLELAKEAGCVIDQRYKGEVTFISNDALERFAALLSEAQEGEPWKCAAKTSAPEPTDCDWPVCGCDPIANKVIGALEEGGAFSKHNHTGHFAAGCPACVANGSAGFAAPPSSDQVWNEAIEAAVQKCERRLHRQFNKTIHAVTSCMNAIRSLKRPSQAQEPTNGELLRAIQGTIPLVEPVHITKALRAGRKAQVCLSGGTGPLACVMLVNIQLTPWIHSEDTAKAFADGYNRALEQHRAALLELIKNFEAQPSASGVVGEQSAFPERDSSKPTEHQGIFRKFDVRRVDGSDQPGGKHYGCRYFVLDLDHDQHAPAAMRTYAAKCRATHPQLAADIQRDFGEQSAQVTDDLLSKSFDEWQHSRLFSDPPLSVTPYDAWCAALSRVQAAPKRYAVVPNDAQIAETAVQVGLTYGPDNWSSLREFVHHIALILAAPSVNEQGGGK